MAPVLDWINDVRKYGKKDAALYCLLSKALVHQADVLGYIWIFDSGNWVLDQLHEYFEAK